MPLEVLGPRVSSTSGPWTSSSGPATSLDLLLGQVMPRQLQFGRSGFPARLLLLPFRRFWSALLGALAPTSGTTATSFLAAFRGASLLSTAASLVRLLVSAAISLSRRRIARLRAREPRGFAVVPASLVAAASAGWHQALARLMDRGSSATMSDGTVTVQRCPSHSYPERWTGRPYIFWAEVGCDHSSPFVMHTCHSVAYRSP